MPMIASRVEPQAFELPTPGSTAKNNRAQDFLSESILARMPYFDRTSAIETTGNHLSNETSSLGREKNSAPSCSGLATRMKLLIRNEGSMASIARRCGFSEGAVRSWRDGQSDISRERCVVMAKTLNVSLIWLITGEGSMRGDDGHGDFASQPPAATIGSAANTSNIVEPAKAGASMDAHRYAVNPRLLASALRLLQSYIGLLGGSLNPTQRADALAELYDILSTTNDPNQIDRLIAFHSTLSGQVRRGNSFVA
ncbi:helix-turn-helix transcriptional regulator [Rhodanobacter sp. L36]|uniref:helix-turn-helix domain-containing protein n=1 Tax=Rhodanobacter sp. L36 TaxID=1747221 RepID=UPI00131B9C27|nr:helix-turn-helix transcriptional regulator [Rhodanobacter sp. L36]